MRWSNHRVVEVLSDGQTTVEKNSRRKRRSVDPSLVLALAKPWRLYRKLSLLFCVKANPKRMQRVVFSVAPGVTIRNPAISRSDHGHQTHLWMIARSSQCAARIADKRVCSMRLA
jgi:hypothetical protein